MITKDANLPQFVRDLLSACPTAGGGVNSWLFKCARVLHPLRSETDIEVLLAAAAANCGRPVSSQEITRAIANSRHCAWQPGTATASGAPTKWPPANLEQIEAIVTDGIGLVDLWDLSPVRFSDNAPHTEDVVDVLFPGNPLLCAGASNRSFQTKSREEWRGYLANLALVVPSPMTASTGRTQEGKTSAHTLQKTGARRFLVIECDLSIYAPDGKTETAYAPFIRHMASAGVDTLDIGASILWHLTRFAPLAAAVHSGGKSLHGWYFAAGQDEERLRKFMRYAVSIGADRATWSRSQFVRMPDGTRENGKRQTVFFLNPGVVK